VHHARHLRVVRAGGLREDVVLLALARVVDADVQQEAIELRFRQRIRARLFERFCVASTKNGDGSAWVTPA
jgi:hypothetical protein